MIDADRLTPEEIDQHITKGNHMLKTFECNRLQDDGCYKSCEDRSWKNGQDVLSKEVFNGRYRAVCVQGIDEYYILRGFDGGKEDYIFITEDDWRTGIKPRIKAVSNTGKCKRTTDNDIDVYIGLPNMENLEYKFYDAGMFDGVRLGGPYVPPQPSPPGSSR